MSNFFGYVLAATYIPAWLQYKRYHFASTNGETMNLENSFSTSDMICKLSPLKSGFLMFPLFMFNLAHILRKFFLNSDVDGRISDSWRSLQ